jgi:hypothetical protein
MASLPVVMVGEASSQSATFDPIVLLAFIPFILFLITIYWGKQRKDRKKRVLEICYNLIGLQLLFYLLLPICEQPVDCALWSIIPILMFAALMGFAYYRMRQEADHHLRVARALADGHVERTGLMQGKIEEELAAEEKKSKKKALEEKPRKEEKKEEPSEKPDHSEIESLIDGVVKKKRAKN